MIKGSILVLAALVAAFAACRSPLDIDVPRNRSVIDLDTVAKNLNATKDTIFATIREQRISFSYQVERPIFHNDLIDGAYYIMVQATSNDPSSPNYSRISLRLDAIRDTGTYIINAYYSAPKGIDTGSPPQYSAMLERRDRGISTMFRTGDPRSHGEVHIVRFDMVNKIIAGTFRFVGYSTEDVSSEEVQEGVFQLNLME